MQILGTPALLFIFVIALSSMQSSAAQKRFTATAADSTGSSTLRAVAVSEALFGSPSTDARAITRSAFRYRDHADLFAMQSPPPPKVSKPPKQKIERVTIDPSMVGYIDDAGPRTEVRIRFDAAVHDDTPDRAEFFYSKCGCYRGLPTSNAAYDPDAPGPGPGIPQYVNFQQLYLLGEFAPYKRLSVFSQIPIRWLQPHSAAGTAAAFASSDGISDLQLGLKFAVIVTPRTILTAQLRSSLPTGDSRSGLGTNHASLEPEILYSQHLSDRLTVEAEVGDTHPLGSSHGVPTSGSPGFAGDVFFYGVGPSYVAMKRENFKLAPVLELVGWNVISGLATGRTDTAGVNIVNLKLGLRMQFGAHSSLYEGYGIALTSQTWYREIFRTEYRYTF